MGNIIDYARTETRSFEALPFREADALVLAQLSYDEVPECVLLLDDLVAKYGTLQARAKQFDIRRPIASLRMLRKPPFGGVTIARADDELNHDKPVADHDVENVGLVDPQVTHDFYHAVAANPRFSDVEMSAYCEQFDGGAQTQFAAVTFRLPSGTLVVAFRGTDDSLVGWKEDFNMSFETEVPAQRDAVAYAQHVAKAIDLPLIVGGHSKGGNLAAYAGMFVDEATRARIQTVYNFDGPGFNEATISSEEFGKVDMRIRTFVPQSSMIGILMWHREPFTIVRSNGVGVFQHDAYTWQIMGGDFIKLSERTGHSHFADDTIKRWLEELKPDMRRQAIDGIYAVLSASNGMNVSDLFEARNTMSVLKAAGAMDEKTRSAVLEAFRLLGSSMIGGVPAWLERTASSVAQKMPWEQRREEAKAHAEQQPPELAK